MEFVGLRRRGESRLGAMTTITGIYGFSFVVAAFNALLAWSDCAPRTQTKTASGGPNFGARLLVLLVMGIGPRFVPNAEAHHLARVVQPNFPENDAICGDWYAITRPIWMILNA